MICSHQHELSNTHSSVFRITFLGTILGAEVNFVGN